jgi:hypothetical protein
MKHQAGNIMSEYLALVIRQVQRVLSMQRCIVMRGQYFYTLSHKGHDFRQKTFIEHDMCVLISLTTFS